MDTGSVERGFLGIAPFNLNPAIASQLGLPVSEGVIVVRVFQGTGAARAGLREKDVIVQLGDQPIPNSGQLSKFLIAHQPGETVDLVYYRGPTKITTKITLGETPQ
jgi:S1-C subfamily serine protease